MGAEAPHLRISIRTNFGMSPQWIPVFEVFEQHLDFHQWRRVVSQRPKACTLINTSADQPVKANLEPCVRRGGSRSHTHSEDDMP